MKVLGIVIGLLLLVGACSSLAGSGDTQPASLPAAPAIVSTPTLPPTPPPPAAPAAVVQQPAAKPAVAAVAPKPPTAPKQPARKAPAAPAPKPAAKTYANCSEAKAAGAAPLRVGQPGYSRSLDRDGDGIACEKK